MGTRRGFRDRFRQPAIRNLDRRCDDAAQHPAGRQSEFLMPTLRLFIPLLAITAGTALGQTAPRYLEDVLKEEVLPQSVAQFQLRQYILNRVPKPPAPSNAAQWTSESKRIR